MKLQLAIAISTSVLLTACAPAKMETVGPQGDSSLTISSINPPLPLPPSTSTPVVCDPLGGGSTATSQHGLKGTLMYVPAALQIPANLQTMDQIRASSITSNVAVFMSQLNVPTRSWTDGFSTDGANSLVDASGTKLLEYFSLHMDTVVKLTASDPSGDYQFATIADDGALVYKEDAAGVKTILAGVQDTIHSTRADCGTVTTAFNSTTELPIKIDYYQGPRTEIAMVLLWRKVADRRHLDMTGCGSEGNDFYLPAGASKYDAFIARGWKPVPQANLWLPASSAPNPCVIH
jgi:hypothetical protein